MEQRFINVNSLKPKNKKLYVFSFSFENSGLSMIRMSACPFIHWAEKDIMRHIHFLQ